MPQKPRKPKFAPLTLDSTFKKAFANEQSTELLLFLLNTFLAEKLKSPIKEVININHELFGKTRFNRDAVFDVYCKDATGPKSFKEKELLQIFKVAEISNFTERELKQYEVAMMNRHDQKTILAWLISG